MVRDEFQEQIDWESHKSNQKTVAPLNARQSILMYRDESAEKLNAKNLDNHDDGPNDNEGRVGVNSLEYVYFIVDLS